VERGNFEGFDLHSVIERYDSGLLTVLPPGLCVAAPDDKGLFETASRECVGIRVCTVDNFKSISIVSLRSKEACFSLYFNKTSDCATAIDLMLQDAASRDDGLLILNLHDESHIANNRRLCSFPFDCPEGPLIFARHPHVCWEFSHFSIDRPEHLLECRFLSLESSSIEVNPRFERKRDHYRGSLSLLERDPDLPMLDAWGEFQSTSGCAISVFDLYG